MKKKSESTTHTPELRKKSRKPTSKFQQFIHYGLKQKLRCWVLAPLFIGIIVTVAISFAIVLYVEPYWFTVTGDEIVNNQLNSMQSITGSLSDYMREYIQRIVNDLLFISNYTQKVVDRNPYYYNPNKTLTAFPILKTTDPTVNAKIAAHPLKNMGYFAWYLDETTTNYSNISNQTTIDNMNIAKNLDIVVRPVYRNADRLLNWENKSNYVAVTHTFENDGLFYMFPCPSENLTFDFSTLSMDQDCLATKGSKGQAVCSIYYRMTKQYLYNLNKTFFISPPYPLNKTAQTFDNKTGLALMACKATMNGSNPSLVQMISCIMANVTDLALHLNESSACQLGEVTLLGYNDNGTVGEVILRVGNTMNLSSFYGNPNRSSLMFWEFQQNDSSVDPEVKWLRTVFYNARNRLNGSWYDRYQRGGNTYLVVLAHVSIYLGYDLTSNDTKFTLMFSISQQQLLANFENVKSEIKNRLLTQLLIIGAVIIVILIISLQTINFIANSIVAPMDDLVMKVRKMQDGDDEVEITENFTQKSYEINCLYFTFSKLANVLKYANKAFFDGNDAEALIRYAQALKLFSDLNNRKAMASIYNNIGNIHLVGERYEEAIENYRLSVEITEEELKKTTKLQKGKSIGPNGTKKNFKERESASSASRYSNLHYSLKNEAKKSSNGSSYRDSSKRSTIGPQSVAETKSILESQIANRQYQLVNALIVQAEKQKMNNWDEITKRLNKVLQLDLGNKKTSSRVVKTHILVSNAFLEIGDFKKSLQHVVSAEEKLREYTNMFTQGMLGEREIPPDILSQKVLLQKGMILKKIGRIRTAAQKFTDCLEIGTVFDPEIRRKCLEQLKEILESKSLIEQAPNIPKLLENTLSKKNKDIVFALDFSESMKQPGRLQHATKAIVTIYDEYIKDSDRVGFIKFNKNVDVIFGLSERGKNRVYLRKCLQNVDDINLPHGETAFFTAIRESLRLHKKAERKEHSRWIVALTDGEDNASRIKYEEIFQKLKNSDINLIIVGLALDEKIIPLLRELCLATPEGVFIETPVSKDLDIAFQSITDIIYGTSDIIIESWS